MIIDLTDIEFLVSWSTRDAVVNKKYGLCFFISVLFEV